MNKKILLLILALPILGLGCTQEDNSEYCNQNPDDCISFPGSGTSPAISVEEKCPDCICEELKVSENIMKRCDYPPIK